jgi:hypothetical protein
MADPIAELEATKAALQALESLDQEQAGRALRWLAEIRGVSIQSSAAATAPLPPFSAVPMTSAPPYHVAPGQYAPGTDDGPPVSPKEFLASKRPKSGAERIACLAFYLAEFRNTPRFKTSDIVLLNTQAAQHKLGNPSRDVDNAERSSGYLASAGAGTRQISTRGEALVRALPDRGAVDEALKDHPVRRRKPAAKKSTAKTTISSDGTSTAATDKPCKAAKRVASPAQGLPKP